MRHTGHGRRAELCRRRCGRPYSQEADAVLADCYGANGWAMPRTDVEKDFLAVAMKAFATQPSSSLVEGVFSVAGRGVSRFQQKMRMSTLEAKLMSKFNAEFVPKFDKATFWSKREVMKMARQFNSLSADERAVLEETIRGLQTDIAISEADGAADEVGEEAAGMMDADDEEDGERDDDVAGEVEESFALALGLGMADPPDEYEDHKDARRAAEAAAAATAEDASAQSAPSHSELFSESFELGRRKEGGHASTTQDGPVVHLRRTRRTRKPRRIEDLFDYS